MLLSTGDGDAGDQPNFRKAGNVEEAAMGRELPILSTDLLPWQAKTSAEKELRMMEGILRNRAAAQSSRKRKQQEVQAFEEERTRLAITNDDLRARLVLAEAANKAFCQELEAIQETLEHYEEYVGVGHGDIAAGSLVNIAAPRSPTPYIALPAAALREQEDLLNFLDGLETPPVTTINPSFLKGRGLSHSTEAIISISPLSC
ncbi:hypothetical protein HOY80DRAFT_1070061 [Tuber brumale]|nr:hypothetical protein HOY80DRAFT_1070061 [Tuber brumale]